MSRVRLVVRTIVRRSGTVQRPILRLDGMERREDAEALRGQALLLEPEQAPALEPQEYWSHDLEGCAVCDQNGQLGAGPVGDFPTGAFPLVF